MSITGDEISESEKRLRTLEQGLREANEKIGRLEGAQKIMDERVIKAVNNITIDGNVDADFVQRVLKVVQDAQRRGVKV